MASNAPAAEIRARLHRPTWKTAVLFQTPRLQADAPPRPSVVARIHGRLWGGVGRSDHADWWLARKTWHDTRPRNQLLQFARLPFIEAKLASDLPSHHRPLL